MVTIVEKEKKFDGRCDVCGTTFTYTADDLTEKYKGKDGEELACIKCPVCGLPVTNLWHNRPEIQPFLY